MPVSPNEQAQGTMNLSQRFLSTLSAVALLGLSSGAIAGPVSFTITSAQFLPGSGYGIDSNEASGTLLDVRFSNSAFSTLSFSLTPGQFATFNFGTVDLEEPEASGGIVANETDALDINAKLTLTAPAGLVQTINATGQAFVGVISDGSVDYGIDWSPVSVAFGNGGLFEISLSDMAISGDGVQFQTATIRLLQAPNDVTSPTNIPEPASIALVGIGLSCVAVTRRRRAKA